MTIGPEQTVAQHMRDKRRAGFVWLAMALVLAATLGATYRTDKQLMQSSSQVETLKGQVSANGQIAQSAKDAAEEANRRLAAAGKPTVPVPTESPVSPVPREIPVDEFTAEEESAVRQIVAEQIALAKTPITQAEITQIARVAATLVPKPKDGKSVTTAELQPLITVALATYCANDRCVGKPAPTITPRPGRDGRDGADAPKVTDEQLRPLIVASLANYCAQDSRPCDGKIGPTGPPCDPAANPLCQGPAGKPGRGIADTDCVGDGDESYWRIHYSDGTEGRVLGPCRLGPAPATAKKIK